MIVLCALHNGPFAGNVIVCEAQPQAVIELTHIRTRQMVTAGRYVADDLQTNVDDLGIHRVDYWWVQSAPTERS